jgi:fumarylacetoacetase
MAANVPADHPFPI